MTSNFPESIDDLMFFQDRRIRDNDTYKIFKKYQTAPSRNPAEASEQLQSSYATNGTNYYGAFLYNSITDRLDKIGSYIKAKEPAEKYIIYQSSTPSSPKVGKVWIS